MLEFRKKIKNYMNILEWTVVVIVGIASVTAVAVTFLIPNSANTIFNP